MHFTRGDDGQFTAYVGDPEHGGRTLKGESLETAAPVLHPKVLGPIVAAFDLEDPSEADISALLPRHEVVFA